MKSATVLVVEDNAVTRRMLDVALGEAGYRVLLAPDAKSAIAEFQREPADVVIQDIGLPDMNGFRLVERLRELPRGEAAAIIAFTGFTSAEENELIAKAPFDGLLIKPVAPSRILDAIAEQLARPRGSRPARPPSAELDPLQRVEIQASALGVLGTIADALSRGRNVEDALTNALAQMVDAAGLSRGAILLLRDDGSLRCLVKIGFDASVPLESLVEGPIHAEIRHRSAPIILTPAGEQPPRTEEFLAASGASSAVLAPIASGHEEFGVLLLTSSTKLLTGEEWSSFARAIASQLGQAIALRRAFLRAEEAAAHSRALFESMPVGLIRTTLDGRILDANPAAQRVFGFGNEAAMRAANMHKLYADVGDRARILERLAREGEIRGYSCRMKRQDGALIDVEVSATARTGGGIEAVEGAFIDVTELRLTQQQLIQAQKIEAVGQLAGGIAHDFNNVLAAITVFTELVANELPQGSGIRSDLDQVQVAVDHGRRLTRQLLAFSRRQVLKPEVLNPNTAIEDVRRILDRLIGEDIALETDLAPDVDAIRVDPGQLEQVFMNLAVNARDAMPSGGRLIFGTRRRTLAEAEAKPMGLAAGDYSCLTVADTGSGMSAETLARAFEPFYTTKGVGKGTGLGLATVHGIIHQSGGHVSVDSAAGTGTTFTILLPAVAQAGPTRSSQPAGRSMPRGTETILIAEDEAAVRHAAAAILERLGYTVIQAASGAEALEKARRHTGPIHLLLSDLVMPGISGLDLRRRLRETRPELRALLTSGYPGSDDQQKAIVTDAIPFLDKPFTGAALAARVREILDAPAAS